MIDFFSSWVKSLGLAIVIVSILEMLLPNNKTKKYVRVIMGIFIIFNIISPFIENRNLIDLDSLDVSNMSESIEINSKKEVNQTSMNERIAQLCKDELEKDITQKLKKEGYEVNFCKVNVKFEENERTKINKINIQIKKIDKAKENEENIEDSLVKEVQKIRKVEIGSSQNEKKSEDIDETDIFNIKKFLIEEYEVDEKCLEIN